MFKILSCDALGISGRQSEIIELALSYRYGGIEIDIPHFCKQVELRGIEHARRFIDSAKIKIGSFPLPTRWQGDDGIYRDDLAKLPRIAEVAATIGATACYTAVMPTCPDRPYHENFEFHRHRLTEVGDLLARYGVKLGLDFLAPAYHREDSQFHFISSAEPVIQLARTIGLANVGVVLDTWNWYVGGDSLDMAKDLAVEQIVAVRLADCPADADRETIREDQRMLPGRGGAIDCAAIISHLREAGYEGGVTPYPHPAQFSSMTRDAIVKQTADATDAVWRPSPVSKEVTPATPAATE